MSRIEELLDAVNRGRIVFSHSDDAKVIYNIAHNHRVRTGEVRLVPELENLLLALATAGTVSVLSLYRRGQGPHGVVERDGKVACYAVDINAFSGTAISVQNPATVIRVIADLIRLFPGNATYDLGFPRPVGGATGFDAARDVFFPVRDEATARKCFDGTISLPMNRMMQPARAEINRAMASGGGNFNLKYPDGLNHLHIKTYSMQPSVHHARSRSGKRR